jgi:hypothetical protein
MFAVDSSQGKVVTRKSTDAQFQNTIVMSGLFNHLRSAQCCPATLMDASLGKIVSWGTTVLKKFLTQHKDLKAPSSYPA